MISSFFFSRLSFCPFSFFFFFNDPATPEISPLPLPAPLPICLERLFLARHFQCGGHVPGQTTAHDGRRPAVDGAPGPNDAGTAHRRLAHHAIRLGTRSEEHTSELQSPCNLVCRLLLEKKKKKK